MLGLQRDSARGRLLILGNFSEKAQTVPAYRLQELRFAGTLHDHLTGQNLTTWPGITLAPYQVMWLEAEANNSSVNGRG